MKAPSTVKEILQSLAAYRFKSRGLFWYVFLTAILSGLVVAAGALVFARQIDETIRARVLEERRLTAEAVAQRLDCYLGGAVRSAELALSWGAGAEPGTGPQDYSKLARAIRLSLGDRADSVVLLDHQLQSLASDPADPALAARDWQQVTALRQALRPNESGIRLLTWTGSAEPMAALLLPAADHEGELASVVVALNLENDTLLSFLDPLTLGSTGYAALVNAETVLASTRGELRWTADDTLDQCVSLALSDVPWAAPCADSLVDAAPERSTPEVIAAAPLNNAPWWLLIHQAQSEAFAEIRWLRNGLLLLVALALVSAIVGAWILASWLVRPLRSLSRSCQAIEAGDLDQPLAPVQVAEARALSESFDRMRARLRTARTEVASAQAELEQRVEARTAELTQSQQQLLAANRQLVTLNRIGEALWDSPDLPRALRTALQVAAESTGADGGSVCVCEADCQSLEVVACWPADCSSCPRCCQVTCECGLLQPFLEHRGVEGPSVWLSDGRKTSCCAARQPDAILACTTLVANGHLLGLLMLSYPGAKGEEGVDRGLLTMIGRSIGMAVENGRLFRELQEKEASQAHLLRQVIAAQEEERQRIARELHDETSQALTAVSLGIETAIKAPACQAAEVKQRLEPLLGTTRNLLVELQRLIRDLRPSLLDDLGLVSAIDWYAESRLASQGVQVEWEVLGEERRLPTQIETVVFRVAQEAISNAARHAAPSRVQIRVLFAAGEFGLRVEDDGCGFDTAVMSVDPVSTGAYGLAGMRERVALLGGKLAVTSQPGTGTTVSVTIPLPGYHDDQRGSNG